MKVTTLISAFLFTSTKAIDNIKGRGYARSLKTGVGPVDSKDKDKTSPPPPPPDDSKDKAHSNNNDDDHYSNKDTFTNLSNYVDGTSNNGKTYDDFFYGYEDDDIDSAAYRTISSKHNNNNGGSSSKKKQNVDILLRPYGSTCPRIINPSNTNSNSDKDFILVIYGSSDLDVKTIEPYSIRLSGLSKEKPVSAVSWDILEIGKQSSTSTGTCHCTTTNNGSTDGKLDLLVRFKESSVVKIPELSKANSGDIVTLILKAHTSSSSFTYIKGEDCIKKR